MKLWALNINDEQLLNKIQQTFARFILFARAEISRREPSTLDLVWTKCISAMTSMDVMYPKSLWSCVVSCNCDHTQLLHSTALKHM